VSLQSINSQITDYYQNKPDSVILKSETYCIIYGNKIVSFLKYSDGIIHLISTHPKYSRRGLGTVLIKKIQGITNHITLIVDANNRLGIEGLLLANGFVHKSGNIWEWFK